MWIEDMGWLTLFAIVFGGATLIGFFVQRVRR